MTDNPQKPLMENIQKEIPLVDGVAIEKMAGKRIRDIYYKRSHDGSTKQLVLISTDFDGFVLSVSRDKEELLSSHVLHNKFSKMLDDSHMNTVYSGLMDPDFSEAKKVARLFHKLWSKAVGTSDYVKSEWIELGIILDKAGYRKGK